MHVRRMLFAAAALLLPAAAACDETPVNLPEATSVSVAATEMKMTVGDAAPLAAQVLDQQGRAMSGGSVAYSSDNPTVASVDPGGVVRAVSPGSANVTAAYGSVKATAKVTVDRDERGLVKTLDVLADSVSFDVRAGTQTLVVQGYNGFGQPVCPSLSVHSSDPSVVTAAPAGGCRISVAPQFRGTATLVVQADRGADSVRVRVTSDGALAFLSSRPAASAMFAGNTVTYGVKVMDSAGKPLAGRAVKFDVSAGSLSALTGTTDSAGVVTVKWTLPTDLRTLGSNQVFSFRTVLPNGLVSGGNDLTYVNAGPAVTLTMFQYTSAGLTPLAANSTLSFPLYDFAHVGAAAADAYGNPSTDISFSYTGPGYTCGTFRFGEATLLCVYTYSPGAGTLTASSGGVSKSVILDFHY
jgi:hypothetical protein